MSRDLHTTPTGSAVTLGFPSGQTEEILIPLGRLVYKQGRTGFLVVRLLGRQEYGVICDPDWDAEDGSEDMPIPPEGRVATFPGTRIKLSTGVLSELFTDKPTVLIVEGVEGFELRQVIRLGGDMRML